MIAFTLFAFRKPRNKLSLVFYLSHTYLSKCWAQVELMNTTNFIIIKEVTQITLKIKKTSLRILCICTTIVTVVVEHYYSL